MYREKAKGWLKHADFIVLDLLCLQFSFLIAYVLRHGFSNPYALPLYRSMSLALMLMDIAVIFLGNVYSSVLKRDVIKEAFFTLVQSGMIVMFSTTYLFAFQAGGDYSRIVLFLTGIIYGVVSFLCRLIWKRVVPKIGSVQRTALLVAVEAERAAEVLETLTSDAYRAASLIGVAIMDEGESDNVQALCCKQYFGVPVVAVEKTLIEYICREWVDEVLLVLPDSPKREALCEQIIESGIVLHLCIGEAKSELGRKQTVENMSTYTVMTTSINSLSFNEEFIKRFFDIVGGLIGSVIAVLALLLFGPIIYFQSPGPILFRQVRIGRNGHRFNFWKIRSMVPNADAMKQQLMVQNRVKDGMMFKLDCDPRIIGTKVMPDGTVKQGIGQFIRHWSIDELPQFFNVLKGDMSLVGTRPPTVDEWEKYQLHHRARLAFKPGITGLWQVSGRSNITNFEDVVKLDTQYIREWSFGLDFRILVETIKTVLKHSGAM